MKLKNIVFGLVGLMLLSGCNPTPSTSETPSVSSEAPISEITSVLPSEEESEVVSSAEESSATDPSSEAPVSEAWEAPEEVWVPDWDFTPMTPYDGNYWNGLDLTLRGSALADALRAHIRATFRGVTYNVAGDAVVEMDRDPFRPNRVLTIYDLRSRSDAKYFEWNREHVFPQSKLADGNDDLRAGPNKVNISSDIANLFACDWDVNETKSNLSLGEWNYTDDPEFYFPYLTRNTEGLLTDNILRRGFFSPSWQSRGETARSQLYMVLMYPDNCGINENFNVETMIQWTYDVPLYAERDGQRQAGLEKYQNMRNPFIDFPNLGCYIWGDENSRTQKLCAGKY